jgi:NUMOD3 motif
MTGASLKGRKQTPEHVANMAAARRGWVPSEETRRRISAARTGHTVPRVSCVGCRKVLATNTLTRHRCHGRRDPRNYQRVYVEHNGPGPWPCSECPDLVSAIGCRRGEGNVHHIDGDETNDAPDNLTMLHGACHQRLHVREGQQTCPDCGRTWGRGWLARHRDRGLCR